MKSDDSSNTPKRTYKKRDTSESKMKPIATSKPSRKNSVSTQRSGRRNKNELTETPMVVDNSQTIMPNVGLGDTIANVTERTGIKKLVEWFSEKTGIDCGCDDRQKLLNEKFPSTNVPKCLTNDEFNQLDAIVKSVEKNHQLVANEQQIIFGIHNRIFRQTYRWPTSCGDCVRKVYAELRGVYTVYLNEQKRIESLTPTES